MSNPDTPGPYWQEPNWSEPVGAGRRAARNGPGRGDRYARDDGYGAGGNGRSNGNGYRAGNGRAAGYDRPAGHGAPGPSRRRDAYGGDGYEPRGDGRTGRGSGRVDSGRDGHGPDDGHRPGGSRRAARRGQGGSWDPEGADDPRGRRRPVGGMRARGAQIGSDLRSRLGLGNGARNAGDALGSNAPRASRPWASRRGTRADTQLRARLGLRSEADPAAQQTLGGVGGDYGGADAVGYRGHGGTRGATALRERGTGRFTNGDRLPGARRVGGPGDGGPGDGWDDGPRKRKGSWWRHWTWRKALAVIAAGFAAMILLFAAAVVYEYQKTQIPTAVSELALQQSSTVYFGDGKTQVGTFSANGIDRQMLTSSQIPTVMKDAIVAAEDRNFYHEGGISITGILRSAYHDLSGSGGLQGGSTLTEEFAKNYYTTIGTSRSMSTKIKEIFVSIKLSHTKSKDWIMTQYLNTVPFGNNAYGVAAAAQVYFNEPATKLTVSQAAMLAAMVNQPGFFSPDPKAGEAYTALVSRWHYVLTNMVRDGVLTQQQADAQTFPKVSTVNQLAVGWTGFKGYIMSAVQSELKDTYGYSYTAMDSRGLKIITTISLQKMRALYLAVNENLAQMKADGTPLPRYAHVGAVLEQPGTGAILAMYGGPNYSATHCARIYCQLNMATQNREQVGSSFKPYVLATAVDEGMNVSNSVLNGIEPMCVPPDSTSQSRAELSLQATNCPPSFFPVNIPGENMGPLTVAKAAALSSDPGFEDLIHRAGTQQTVDMARKFGVNISSGASGGSGLQSKVGEVGLALGIASLTVEEQATTFATLANNGIYVTPHVIAQITDNGNSVPLKITHREVLSAAAAADVDYALSFDTIYGTAVPNGILSPFRPTIGKTGTTDNYQSAFFLGAIPQYSLAVGMFTNQQNGSKTGESLSGLASVGGQGGGFGGAWPTSIWHTFMQNEFANLTVLPFATPDFNGFTKWVQVPKQRHKPGKHHDQNPNPNPSPSCGPGHHHHGQPCPGPGPGGGPSPSPTSPGPSPTSPGPSPTAGPLTAAAALLLVAEEPSAPAFRRPGGG